MSEPVRDIEGWCDTCEHVHEESTNRPSRLWLCRKFKRRWNVGQIVHGEWAKDEPFGRCVEFNERYICPNWEQRKEEPAKAD